MGTVFKGRREDGRLLTGTGRYTADWDLPGQVHAAFVRADRAHATIDHIDIAASRAAPGVLAVLTASDMAAAGYTRGQAFIPFPGKTGPLKAPKSPALAEGRVRFVGEPVVLVIAETAHAAQDAAELAAIDYGSLDAVVDARAALAPGAPQLHDSIPGNLCFEHEFGDETATSAAFTSAAHVVRLEQDSNRVVGNPMEPKAALVAWTGDLLELWSSSQGMPALRLSLSVLTGHPQESIRVHAHDVGGAFGIRGQSYPEYAALALASRQIGRPVKWVASRSETFLSDFHGRAVSMAAELALDAEGRVVHVKTGAFRSLADLRALVSRELGVSV